MQTFTPVSASEIWVSRHGRTDSLEKITGHEDPYPYLVRLKESTIIKKPDTKTKRQFEKCAIIAFILKSFMSEIFTYLEKHVLGYLDYASLDIFFYWV